MKSAPIKSIMSYNRFITETSIAELSIPPVTSCVQVHVKKSRHQIWPFWMFIWCSFLKRTILTVYLK